MKLDYPAFLRETKEIENKMITIALARTGGNRTHAAALLGMPMRTLQRKIIARLRHNH
ncbi:MAG: helix-turn-helix domain-containing protein [Planctomycetota bacterium]|jgi:DNA-binding NtrC family response regulator